MIHQKNFHPTLLRGNSRKSFRSRQLNVKVAWTDTTIGKHSLLNMKLVFGDEAQSVRELLQRSFRAERQVLHHRLGNVYTMHFGHVGLDGHNNAVLILDAYTDLHPKHPLRLDWCRCVETVRSRDSIVLEGREFSQPRMHPAYPVSFVLVGLRIEYLG